MINIKKYKSFVFDCDGVILDSNMIKTKAFKVATASYGNNASNALETYHLLNGGVSRYEKFNYFLTSICPVISKKKKELLLKNLLKAYSEETEKGLLNAEITYGLEILRSKTKNSSWSIVSGGDQKQLCSIFEHKKLVHLFDGGIFGSPDTKNLILKRELVNKNIKLPALFLGDTALDHKVSVANGLDFIFISAWTEFLSYKEYCLENSIKIIPKVFDLIS